MRLRDMAKFINELIKKYINKQLIIIFHFN